MVEYDPVGIEVFPDFETWRKRVEFKIRQGKGEDSSVFMAFLDDWVKKERTYLIEVVVEGQMGNAGLEQILKSLLIKAGRLSLYPLATEYFWHEQMEY